MKKTLLITCLFILTGYFSSAQTPVLKIGNEENTEEVYLQQLDIRVDVVGNIATTTMTMAFKNRTTKILEGELLFPLPEGVTVSGYALDINGTMRKAVPVEKAKATQVFEEIERRRVDPGLLERVEGNNFRTRIYPIPSRGTRTVAITYEQELKAENGRLRYHLPTDYKNAIDKFSLQAVVNRTDKLPVVDEAPAGEIKFDRQGNNYVASFERAGYRPEKSLRFSLPVTEGLPEVSLQSAQGSYYFYVNTFMEAESKPKEWGNTIGVIWDASLSAQQRDLQKELQVLETIIKSKKNLTIQLATLNYTLEKKGTFTIRNGNWTALKNALEATIYDGGTNYGSVDLSKIPADEYLLFSDGLSTLSEAAFKCTKPLHCVVSVPKADYSALKWLALQHKGKFINLNSLSEGEVQQLLLNDSFQFLGIKPTTGVRETYPSVATPVLGNISVAGILDTDKATIVLQFGYGQTVTVEKRVTLEAQRHADNSVQVHRIWAQKKIAELDLQYEEHKETIIGLGQQFGIVTRSTSLIVLETLADYITYRITPPDELRAAYDQAMKQQDERRLQGHQSLLEDAIDAFDDLQEWWNKKFTKPAKPKYPTPDNRPADNQNQITLSAPITTNIVIEEANADADLSEVVVVAYGTSTSDKFSASAAAPAEMYYEQSSSNVTQALHGSASGIQVMQSSGEPGNTPNIRVRGMASISSPNRPLLVVDGEVVDNISDINAEDVESITILKDEASTSVYGAQAANGVVVVNRKNTGARQDNIDEATAETATIRVATIKQDKEYLKALTGNMKKDYAAYLEMRPKYRATPGFYMDMSNWFYQHNDRAKALLVLSAIADLDLENASLFKTLAYKLKEYGEYEQEVFICRKVLQWRPMEPQSYRDYGLALADAGKYQQALDTLYTALTQPFAESIVGISMGIEGILVNEINQLVAAQGRRLNIDAIEEEILTAMPVDIRVVINWNKNNTDIDLHVTDPAGEECYYSHTATAMGGRISEDITRGYGPEEFLLKKAIPGKYTIEVNYFGDTQVKAEGPTTIMAEIYTYYSTGKQERQVVTLQQAAKNKGRKDKILIGEFEFK